MNTSKIANILSPSFIFVWLFCVGSVIFWNSNQIYVNNNEIGLIFNQDFHSYTGDWFSSGKHFIWPFSGNKVLINHDIQSAQMGFLPVKGAYKIVTKEQWKRNVMLNDDDINHIYASTVRKWLKTNTAKPYTFNLREDDFPDLKKLWEEGWWKDEYPRR